MNFTRRDLLKAAGASWALHTFGCAGTPDLIAGPKDLIQRQDKPFNAEPRLDHLAASWITPYRHFYVRSHGNEPVIAPGTWELLVEGLVERPLRIKLEDLEKMAKTTVTATMQCAGNRRNEQSLVKPVGGVQWDAGAIGTAEYRGVRLADVLERAGIKTGAKHLWFEGKDSVTLKDKQTLFGGGVPIAKAMQPGTLVALEMNGAPLAREHGYPARTVVPGFIGARSVKWLGRIIVADRPSENNFVARDYKLFPPEATAETVKPETYDPIYEFILSSAICTPTAGQSLRAGKVRVSGYAVPPGSDGTTIAGVQISPDGDGTWINTALAANDAPYAWKLWNVDLDLPAGPRTLIARATDSQGKLQPEKAPWNFKGYLYNGWHRVPITVA
jgi:sulfite oxidase